MLWSQTPQIFINFLSFATVITIANWTLLLVGAAIVFFIQSDHKQPRTLRGFIRYCFPSEIVRTATCRSDAVLWVLNWLVGPFLITPFIVGSILCSTFAYSALTKAFGPHPQVAETTAVWVLVAIVVLIATDFATFYTHYLDHKIAALWEFHKVHHSAQFLTPITNKRNHPISKIFEDSGVVLVTGVVLGAFSYVLSMPIYENTVIGVDAYFVLNTLSFFHVRHSHIRLTYGRLEAVLMSPAQHQLHHSSEEPHLDKNFGLFLSVWDRWFGTLVSCRPDDTFRLGLTGDENRFYGSALRLYFVPLINVVKMALTGIRGLRTARQPEDLAPAHLDGRLAPLSASGPVAAGAVVAAAPGHG